MPRKKKIKRIRKKESEEQRKRRMERKKLRRRAAKLQETPEQKEARQKKERLRKRSVQAQQVRRDKDILRIAKARAAETPEQKEARQARDRQRMKIARAKLRQERQAAQNIPSSPPHKPRAILPSGTEGYIVWNGVPTSSWTHKPNLAATIPGTESLRPLEEVYIKQEPQAHSNSNEPDIKMEPDIKVEPLESDSEDPGEGGHSHSLHTRPQDTQPQDSQPQDTQPQDTQPQAVMGSDTLNCLRRYRYFVDG